MFFFASTITNLMFAITNYFVCDDKIITFAEKTANYEMERIKTGNKGHC